MKADPQSVLFRLLEGVQNAVPAGGIQKDVTTVITRPMWDEWRKLLGYPPGVSTIHGSRTIIVEREEMMAISYRTPR